MAQIGDILAGEPPTGAEGQPEGAGEGLEGAAQTSPKTLDELAKSAGLEVDALYALAVPLGGDQSMTLGELKDIAKKDSELTVRELEIEERLAERTADLVQSRGELQELFSLLPKSAVSDELRKKAQDVFSAKVTAERKRARESIEGWDDDATRRSDIEGMIDHLGKYGFEKSFLLSVIDHRMVNFIRESWQREKRMTDALRKARELKAAQRGSSAPAGKPPARQSPANGSTRGRSGLYSQVSRVSEVLQKHGM